MPDTPIPYRKLTGMYRSLGALSQLWQGPDHLLHISSTGYAESYRRLYFRDIQGMLIVHTGRRAYLHVALGVVLLFVVLAVSSFARSWIPWVVTFGGFAPLFLWNQLLGPGCRVVVITAVQQENVKALARLPKTRRILSAVTPIIQTAQADLAGVGAVGVPPRLPVDVNAPPSLPTQPAS